MGEAEREDLYKVAEVAKILRCSEKHVYSLVKSGKLKALPFKPIRIPRKAIDRLVNAA